jgi:hypothetical protein
MPADLQLDVAGTGAQVPISKVNTVESDCSGDSDEDITAVNYPASVACSVSTYSSSSAERQVYLLESDFDQLTTTVGVSDASTQGVRVRLRIYTDGQLKSEVFQTAGHSEVVTIPVTGTLQLTLEAQYIGPDLTTSPSLTGVFGSPTLVTSPDIAKKYQNN